MPSVIPEDHLIPPTLGILGFRSPWEPEGWRIQHRVAETGGYLRINRRWELAGDAHLAPIPLPCAPVLALYGGRAISTLDGWCVDA